MFGVPVTIDAVRCGAYAHRLRNFWHNLAPSDTLATMIAGVHRPSRSPVDTIMDKGRTCAAVSRHDSHPFYPANRKGQPRVALPTLVSYPRSNAFRNKDCEGSVYDSNTGLYDEPNPDERERALGYETGATAAPGVTQAERHVITGNCMDQAAVSTLLNFCFCHLIGGAPPFRQVHAVRRHDCSHCEHPHDWHHHTLGSHVATFAASVPGDTPVGDGGGDPGGSLQADPEEAMHPQQAFKGNKKMCRQVAEHDKDIHYDHATLALLRTGKLPDGITPAQIKRVNRRAKGYKIVGHSPAIVYCRMPNGTWRVVPSPAERAAVTEQAHVTSGHFGIRRTLHLMLTDYWWQGIWKDVTNAVNNCKVCDRVKASFNASHSELHPLPIMGLFYRWGVDLCGPFPETKRGHKYVMVMVEHYSKTLVIEPLVSKEAKHTAYAFEHGVLGRFGACAEVVTDQGSEFMGEFQAVLAIAKNFIDHRTTSANHPQADGLAERCVQTVKRSLRRHCEDVGKANVWDGQLAYISMGYNCSKQKSTNVSPYQILYAREPQFSSSAVAQRMGVPIAFDNPATCDQAAAELLARGGYLERIMPTIANNLAIAQHRDRLRYAQTRSGTYLPLVRKFTVGDFVYVRSPNLSSTLQIAAKQLIARVLEVRDSGVVILQGKCGNTLSAHVSSLAPCHLPHMDGSIDPELAIPPADHACESCGFADAEDLMLLCDWCNNGWHTYCLEPKLTAVPKGDWICPTCIRAGISVEQLASERIVQAAERTEGMDPQDKIFHDAKTRAKDAAAASYDGRLVCKQSSTRKGLVSSTWGTVKFRGVEHRPQYFSVKYDNEVSEILTLKGLHNRHPLPEGSIRPSLVTSVMLLDEPSYCYKQSVLFHVQL